MTFGKSLSSLRIKISEPVEFNITGMRIYNTSSKLVGPVVKGAPPTANPWFPDLHALPMGQTAPYIYLLMN